MKITYLGHATFSIKMNNKFKKTNLFLIFIPNNLNLNQKNIQGISLFSSITNSNINSNNNGITNSNNNNSKNELIIFYLKYNNQSLKIMRTDDWEINITEICKFFNKK